MIRAPKIGETIDIGSYGDMVFTLIGRNLIGEKCFIFQSAEDDSILVLTKDEFYATSMRITYRNTEPT